MDLFVYAPAGLVLTVLDDLPGLAAKGRTRVGRQVRTARTVGQMAVLFGRADLERRMTGLWADRASAPPTRSGSPSVAPIEAPVEVPVEGPPDAPVGATGHDTAPAATGARSPTAGRPTRDLLTAARSPGWLGAADGATGALQASSPGSVDLAIPGYDTLSASQVVRRLDSLGPGELAAVHAYESTTRNRRTILSRVEQLQAGATGPTAVAEGPPHPPGLGDGPG